MENYVNFISLIKELIELFDALIAVEQKKLDSVVNNNISVVEECMKKEQAFVLRLRGLEQQRESIQSAMGMQGMAFREILTKVPQEILDELAPLFQELSEKVRAFQSVNDNAKDAIQVNLYQIQSVLDPSFDGSRFYSASRAKAPEETHFTNRFV